MPGVCFAMPASAVAATMRYLVVGLALVALVGLEVFHELRAADTSYLGCAAPETQKEAARELLLQHLKSH